MFSVISPCCRCLLFPSNSQSWHAKGAIHTSSILSNSHPHDVLGVPRNATQDEIRSAYLKKIKLNHPDSDPNDSTLHSKFVAIQEAYEKLQNPQNVRQNETVRSNAVRYARPQHWEGYESRRSSGFDWRKYEHENKRREMERKHNQFVISCVLVSAGFFSVLGIMVAVNKRVEYLKQKLKGNSSEKVVLRSR